MKNLWMLALSVVMLTGCAEKNIEVAEDADAAIAAVETAAPTSRFSEYMWCDAGPDFSAETYAELTAAWNEVGSRATHQVSAAFSIRPKFETDRYDGMWVNVWPSVEARDAGWAEWVENEAEAFGSKFSNVLACDPAKRFLFESFTVTAQVQQWDPADLHQVSYSFCSLKEGKTQEDGGLVAANFAEWIALKRTEGLGTKYMSYLLIPTFDPETIDGTAASYQFVRADAWANAEEQAADMAAWQEDGNVARDMSDATYDCQNFDFDLRPIKNPAI